MLHFYVWILIAISIATSNEDADLDDNSIPKKVGMHRLLADLFDNYDKELMPVRPVYVQMDVLLMKVNTTVERDGTFESVVALIIQWNDLRMRWKPADYDNVTVLAIDSKKVWLPDIAMTNAADHLYDISRDTSFVVRLTYDGIFRFVPTGVSRTWCELTLITFPFDIQTCSLEFESWSLDSATMAFNESASILVDPAFLSTQWTLCNETTTVYDEFYKISGETFSRVKFDFTLRRKSTFYVVNLVFPLATLSVIQLFIFVIPSQESSTDRIGFGTINLLSLFFFQTMATEELPRSDAITVLSKYIIALVLLTAVGLFESILVERLSRIDDQPPSRRLLKTSRFLLTLVGKPSEDSDEEEEDFEMIETIENNVRSAVKIEPISRSSSSTNSGNNVLLHHPSRTKCSRKLSRFTAAMKQRERRKFIEAQIGDKWGEVAAAVDVATCIVSSIVVVIVPLLLFIPLLNFSDECPHQH